MNVLSFTKLECMLQKLWLVFLVSLLFWKTKNVTTMTGKYLRKHKGKLMMGIKILIFIKYIIHTSHYSCIRRINTLKHRYRFKRLNTFESFISCLSMILDIGNDHSGVLYSRLLADYINYSTWNATYFWNFRK